MAKSLTCNSCGHVGFPTFELMDDATVPKGARLVPACGKCECKHYTHTIEQFNEGIAFDGATKTSTVVETANVAAAARVAAPVAHRPAPQPGLTRDMDVIGMISTRHLYLVSEIAKLEGTIAAYKSESKKLGKMLSAAARVAASESPAMVGATLESH